MAGDRIIELVHLALPQLVYHAQLRNTLTYKQLSESIGSHHRPMNSVLGYIRDEICVPEGYPMINAIVTNKNTDLPGHSFLPEGTSDLTKEEYKKRFEQLRDDVFTFPNWESLLNGLGLKSVNKQPEDFNEEARIYSDVKSRNSESGRESELHRNLKEFIANNPKAIDLPSSAYPTIEYKFVSEDRCDVTFELENKYAVVEVKNGDRGELIKGVYQAIKYRALMKAEKGFGNEIDVSAFLVAYCVPFDIVEFAKRFDVRCLVVNIERCC